MAKWTPDKVEGPLRCSRSTHGDRQMFATNRPSTIVWCMGHPAHHRQCAMVRAAASCATGARQRGAVGRRCQHLPRPRHVQGPPTSVPIRIVTRLLRHRDRFLEALGDCLGRADYEWIKKQFACPAMMEKPGMTVSRWIDGMPIRNETIDRIKPAGRKFFWGMRRTRKRVASEMKKAMEIRRSDGDHRPVSDNLVGDARIARRCLPAASVHAVWRPAASATASPTVRCNGARRVISPLFESQTIMRSCTPSRRSLVSPAVRQEPARCKPDGDQAGRTADRGHPSRDQQRHLDDWLHRAVAGAL